MNKNSTTKQKAIKAEIAKKCSQLDITQIEHDVLKNVVERILATKQVDCEKINQWLQNIKDKKRIGKTITNAAKSVLKTSVFRKDRLSDEQVKERLNICRNCEVCTKTKNGDPWICGKMTDAFHNGRKPCGCFLKNKARDSKQKCPLNKWPEQEE